jgi:RNA polymerase sigma factor (sigma-70 family)
MSGAAAIGIDSPGDVELLRRYARHGDAGAFARIVRRYVDLVYSAALRQVRDAHAAEDVTQEVFALLAREAGRMDDGVILVAWLYRAARLVCRNVNKKTARRRRHEMALVTQIAARGKPEQAEWQDLVPLLDEAMAGLKEPDRAAILLRYFQGQSMKEVGAALGLEPNTASKRIERAVEKLRAFFARRGVAVGAGALVAGLEANAVRAAPGHLAETVSGAAAGGTLVSGAVAKGVVIGMTAAKMNTLIGVAAVLVLAILGAGLAFLVGAFRGDGKPVIAVHLDPAAPANTQPAPEPQDVSPQVGLPAVEFADYIPGGTKPMFNNRRAPRMLFRTIHGEHLNEQQGVELVAPGLASLDEGDWVKYSAVDFGQGGEQRATEFVARVSADPPADGEPRSILVRIERPDGPVIATLAVTPTGGAGKWSTQTAAMTAALSGIHDVYLTFGGGKDVANLDWFKFIGKRPVAGRLEAESFDDAVGINDGSFFLSNLDRPDHVLYRRVDFGAAPGPSWMHVRMGVKDGWEGRIVQVRLDRLDGEVIAALTTQATGAWQNMTVQSVPCGPVSGVHDVYVRFSGNGAGDIDWFEFSTDQAPPAN